MTIFSRRSLSWLILLIAAIAWFSSCGFGTATVALGMGSGGGATTAEVKVYGLTRDPSISGTLPVPGQLVAGDLVDGTVSLAADGVYAASWRDSGGRVVAAASVRGMTSRRLAAVVPLGLPAGDYTVGFALGNGRAELPVQVGAGAAVGDPAAVVATARLWWGTQRDALQGSANVDPDAGRQARSLADLARLSDWLTTFDGAVAGLDAGALRTLAELLEANAALRAAEPSDPHVSVDLIAAQSAAAATLAEYGLTALAASGSVTAPAGSSAEIATLLPASQLIGGLVAALTAYDRWTKALARPCKPIEGSLQVTAADGSALTLRFNQPLPLRCRVLCSSLIGADAGDARVADIVAALGEAGALRGALLPTVGQWIGSLAPAMPGTPTVQLADLAAQRLALIAQTSAAGLPALMLEAGALRAAQVAVQSGSLQAQLRIAEALLGSAGGTFAVTLDNSPPSGQNVVVIQPGTFLMGSPVTPLNIAPYFNLSTSQPVHPVTITQPFWMGRDEVTQGQYVAVMGASPSIFLGASKPVENVSWNNAVAYCNGLTTLEAAAGRLPNGYVYRLPTEAEWEYCCRAGTTTEYHYGATLVCGQANFGYSNHTSTYCSNPGGVQTAVVGSYAPNAWGLRDMHGNVYEWCLDNWNYGVTYTAGPVSDPYVTSGPLRVIRGGGWSYTSDNCRSAWRGGFIPTYSFNNIGFRVVCAPVLP